MAAYPPWPTTFFGAPSSCGPIPDMSHMTGLPPSHISTHEWCIKHGLGDEEYQGLVKLGFRIGDELEQLDDLSWRWANLGPLHKQRILAACKSNK